MILATFPDASRWQHRSEYEMLKEAVAKSIDALNGLLPMVPALVSPRGDSRPVSTVSNTDCGETTEELVKIHTDYPALVELVVGNPKYNSTDSSSSVLSKVSFVVDLSDANFFWHVKQASSFLSIPPSITINQFPYEGTRGALSARTCSG